MTIKVDSSVNRASAAAVPSVSYNYTTLVGVAIPFVGE